MGSDLDQPDRHDHRVEQEIAGDQGNGFSRMWAVASSEERVIVTIQEVATNPSRHRTNSLPPQNDRRGSSMALDGDALGVGLGGGEHACDRIRLVDLVAPGDP
jgi:hypothetical protein